MMYGLLDGVPTLVNENLPNWRNIYTTLSGTPFDGADPIEETNSDLEALQAKYVEVYGKQLSPAYKNNVERIQKKLEEATLVPNE